MSRQRELTVARVVHRGGCVRARESTSARWGKVEGGQAALTERGIGGSLTESRATTVAAESTGVGEDDVVAVLLRMNDRIE